MPESEISELVAQIASLISRRAEDLSPDTVIADLALDSMTSVELVVDLQEEHDIVLTREDFEDVRTLGDLAALVRSRRAEPAHD
ncbi:acyl carrier protein [Streptomyces sp. NPDC057245]|uniref:acyl carrier protein n=1 Tax=Streptomyces TaxID=1883 RepID=UPI001C1E5DA9|nr:acyl carrier protein [Streptomyces sp. A108]MBU6533018.1 acyl carrier protein [Streptomyces sp. A108]